MVPSLTTVEHLYPGLDWIIHVVVVDWAEYHTQCHTTETRPDTCYTQFLQISLYCTNMLRQHNSSSLYIFPQKSELPPPGGGLLVLLWLWLFSPGTPILRRPLTQRVRGCERWVGLTWESSSSPWC